MYQQFGLPFDEKLPKWLITGKLPLISYKLLPDYIYCDEIEYYVPREHVAMVGTLRKELQNKDLLHATRSGRHKDCNGFMCKRYMRQYTFNTSLLRAQRIAYQRERAASAAGIILRPRKARINNTEFERLQAAAPQYAAVDPLLVLFCIDFYRKNLAKLPRKSGGFEESWEFLAANPSKIPDFLAEKYGNSVLLKPKNVPKN